MTRAFRRIAESPGLGLLALETDRMGSTVDGKADGPDLPDGCDGDMLLFVRTFRPA